MAGLRAPRAPRRAGRREPKLARAAVAAPLRSGPRAAPASMAAPGPSSGAATASPRAPHGRGGRRSGATLRRGGCALVRLFVFEIQLLPPLREASSSTPRPVPTPAPSSLSHSASSLSAPPPAAVRCAQLPDARACHRPTPNLEPPGGAQRHRRAEPIAELAEPALCARCRWVPAGREELAPGWTERRPSPGCSPPRPPRSQVATSTHSVFPCPLLPPNPRACARRPPCLAACWAAGLGWASGRRAQRYALDLHVLTKCVGWPRKRRGLAPRDEFGRQEVAEGLWHRVATSWVHY